jgi:PAS domain S-box-containing protein
MGANKSDTSKQQLLESEQSYRSIFDTMSRGFAEHEMLYDENGKAVDYRFIRINKAFTKQTTMDDSVVGKTIKEIAPDIDDFWIEKYAKVVKTGKATSFVQYATPFDTYYEVEVYKTGQYRFATVFDDVTEKTIQNQAIKKIKNIQEFMLDISVKYINLEGDEVSKGIQKALDEIGGFVSAERVRIFEYDFEKKICNIAYEWCEGHFDPTKNVLKDIPFSRLQPELIDKQKKNIEVEFSDTSLIEHKELREELLKQGVKSMFSLPIYNGEQLYGFLGINSYKANHKYLEEEKKVLRLFVQIYVNLINRALYDDMLLSSKESYKNLFEHSADATCIVDIKTRKVIDCNKKGLALFEIESKEKAMGVIGGKITPEFQPDGCLSRLEIAKHFKKAVKQGSDSFQFVYSKTTGEVFWARTNLSRLKYQGNAVVQATIQDISMRIKTEQEVAERERDFRNIFNSASNGLLISDMTTGLMLDANPAAIKLFEAKNADYFIGKQVGFPSPERQPNGKTSSEFVKERIEQAVSSKISSFEYNYLLKSGKQIICEVEVNSTIYKGGPALVASIRDISERKKADTEIAARERDLRNIFESSADGLIIVDGYSKRIIDANSTIINMLKWPDKSFLVGQKIGHAAPEYQPNGELSLKVLEKNILKLNDGQKFSFEFTVIQQDGTPIICEIKMQMLEYKHRPAIVISIIDMTQNKKNEEEIRKSEERFRISTESADIITWEWRAKEDVTIASDKYFGMFGFDPTKGDVLRKLGSQINSDDYEAHTQAVNDYITGKTDKYETEYRYTNPITKKMIWVSNKGYVVCLSIQKFSKRSPKSLAVDSTNILEI